MIKLKKFFYKNETNLIILDSPWFYAITRTIFIINSCVIKFIISHFFKIHFMILYLVVLSILNISSYFTIKMLYNLNIERKDGHKVIVITIIPIILLLFLVELNLPWYINTLISTFIEEVFFTNLILIKVNIKNCIYWISNNNNMNSSGGGGGGGNSGGPNPGGPYKKMDINSMLNPPEKDKDKYKSVGTQTDDNTNPSQSSVSASSTSTVVAPTVAPAPASNVAPASSVRPRVPYYYQGPVVASSSQVQPSVENSASSFFFSMQDLYHLRSLNMFANEPGHYWYRQDIPPFMLSEAFRIGATLNKHDLSPHTWESIRAARSGGYAAKWSMTFSEGLKQRLESRYGTVKPM